MTDNYIAKPHDDLYVGHSPDVTESLNDDPAKKHVEQFVFYPMFEGLGVIRVALIMLISMVAVLFFAFLLGGCTTVREIAPIVIEGVIDWRTNRVDDAESPPQPDYAIDAVRYADLQWRHGGFNGSGADFDDRAQIANLSTHRSGMSYRWTKGGCEIFGASGKNDFKSTYACLFYKDPSGAWIGGKFEWISTDRTTRGFNNVNGHDGKPPYKGWNPQAFHASKERCFVIVKTDGSRRTNVIKETR